jgi:hypothetical protein
MRTLNDYFLKGEIANLSASSSSFVVVPDGGRIIKITAMGRGTIATAPAVLSFELGGVAITGGGISFTHTSSVNGTTFSSEPTALNVVEEGGTIEMITTGASTNAVLAEVTFWIRR